MSTIVKHRGDSTDDGLYRIGYVGGLNHSQGEATVCVDETMGGNCIVGGFDDHMAKWLAISAIEGAYEAVETDRWQYQGCEFRTYMVKFPSKDD